MVRAERARLGGWRFSPLARAYKVALACTRSEDLAFEDDGDEYRVHVEAGEQYGLLIRHENLCRQWELKEGQKITLSDIFNSTDFTLIDADLPVERNVEGRAASRWVPVRRRERTYEAIS